MPRPRTPTAVAKATGAFVKNPQRTRKDPKVAPLGPCPDRLLEIENGPQAWQEISEEMPWLGASDRKLVELAARLTARMIADPEMGVNALAQLRLCLAAMGGTPADRSKVSAPENDKEDDPAAEFLN